MALIKSLGKRLKRWQKECMYGVMFKALAYMRSYGWAMLGQLRYGD